MGFAGVPWRSGQEAAGLWLLESHRDSFRPHSTPLAISCFATIQSRKVLYLMASAALASGIKTLRSAKSGQPIRCSPEFKKLGTGKAILMIGIRSEVVRTSRTSENSPGVSDAG